MIEVPTSLAQILRSFIWRRIRIKTDKRRLKMYVVRGCPVIDALGDVLEKEGLIWDACNLDGGDGVVDIQRSDANRAFVYFTPLFEHREFGEITKIKVLKKW
jgi:hypothetical protein